MTENIASPGQVEIAVASQIDDRRLIGRRFKFNFQIIVVGEFVGSFDSQRAGVPLVAVGADQLKRDAGTVCGFKRLHAPVLLVKAFGTAMQVVLPVIDI